jgi:hypothetical protein
MTKPKPSTKPSTQPQLTAPAPIVPPGIVAIPSAILAAALEPERYDEAEADLALGRLRPQLDALPPDAVQPPRVDAQAAALAALGVYAFVTQVAPVRRLFKGVASSGTFELENLARLRDVAFVVIRTRRQAEAAGVFATAAKVPPALITAGQEVEKRMQSLLEYKYANDPEVAPILRQLSPGIGHRDLAEVLLGYAAIYERRAAEVAADTTHYRLGDVAEARRIAGEILGHLSASMSPKERVAYELHCRAWSLLQRTYAEVQALGRWLLRADPQGDERFPFLVAAGRTSKPRKRPAAAVA